MLIVIAGIDAEHHHVRKIRIQNMTGGDRIMCGEAEMTHNVLTFQLFKIAQHAVLSIRLPVMLFVKAMDEAVINIVCLQLFKLPGNATLDLVEIKAPGIAFSRGIDGPEMNLIAHLAAHIGKSVTKERKAAGFDCA